VMATAATMLLQCQHTSKLPWACHSPGRSPEESFKHRDMVVPN
jgi:hypothetical protein